MFRCHGGRLIVPVCDNVVCQYPMLKKDSMWQLVAACCSSRGFFVRSYCSMSWAESVLHGVGIRRLMGMCHTGWLRAREPLRLEGHEHALKTLERPVSAA